MATNPNKLARLHWALECVLVLATLVCTVIWGQVALLAGTFCLMAGFAFTSIEFQRRSRRTIEDVSRRTLEQKHDRDHTLREVSSIMYLYARLHPELPLPSAESWTVRPDLAARVVMEMLRRKLPTVLELGSGVSTVIAATCAATSGGRVISYEADAAYAAATRSLLSERGLEGVAEVHVAPLRDTQVSGRKGPWYGIDEATLPARIDILFVDGPPSSGSELARYPALPMLHGRLADGAVVILDDGGREDEHKIVEMWLREFPDMKPHQIVTRTGAAMLQKT